MSDLDNLFQNAPDGATEIVMAEFNQELRWAKKDDVWSLVNEDWKYRHANWKTIATRPQPEQSLDWNNMKEGMKVVFNGFTNTQHSHWKFEEGKVYVVSRHDDGTLGPLSDSGCVPSINYGFNFSVVEEQPRKTVEDAVEWNKLSGHGVTWAHEECDIITFDPSCDISYSKTEYDKSDGEYVICTREEFEACVAAKAKSEPEWTHEYRLGDSKCWFPCSIVTEVGTQGVVIKCDVFEGIQYCSYNGRQAIELKPIKPTITKAEQEMVAKFIARVWSKDNPDLRKEFDDFCNEHEAVE